MIRIIGFEGNLGDALIAYGAAAIELPDGRIMNSFTRTIQSVDELDQRDALTRFARPWELADDTLADHPLVVVAIRTYEAPGFVDELLPERQRVVGFVARKRERPHAFVLLRDRDALNAYAGDTAQHCINEVLRETWTGPDALGFVRCALTLRPRDPTLLALRVYLSPGVPNVMRTAERLLEAATPQDRDVFWRVLEATANAESEDVYKVVYEEPGDEVGGFDLDDAIAQFTAFDELHEKLQPTLLRHLPFLEDAAAIPKNRLQEFRVGSAEIGLGLRGKNLHDRVVRYVELQTIAGLFRGDVPPELAGDPDFASNLQQILHPPSGATMQHQPLGAARLEPVAIELPDATGERVVGEATFRTVGFVQGFFHEVRRAEIRLSPVHTVGVSIRDDGTQLTPVGAEMLRSGEGVFRPGLFALLRREMSSGKQRWFLQRMTLLSDEPEEADTFASMIVPKALFRPGGALAATFVRPVLEVGASLVEVHGNNLNSALEWIRSWHLDLVEQELEAATSNESEWFPPPGFAHGSGMTPLMRLILTLGRAPQGARVDQLVQSLNSRFRTTMRVKHARWTLTAPSTPRGIFEHEEDDDEDVVRLSPFGMKWFHVLDRYVRAA